MVAVGPASRHRLPRRFRRVLVRAAGPLCAVALLGSAGDASAFVGATVELDQHDFARLVARSDGGSDIVKVSCGDDLNLKVNGLDPSTGPFPCADLERVRVFAAGGNDTVNLTRVGPRNGFTDPDLRKPLSIRAYGSAGSDRITGSRLADLLLGGGGRDFIRGRRGADLIGGSTGSDRLIGGRGRDRLRGGRGDDAVRQ